MSESRIVFIVGAGASRDFGFPVGKTLQDEIVAFLRPRKGGDDGLHPAIEFPLAAIQERGLTYPKIMQHCEWMAETIPLYSSIDAFLDRQSRTDDATSFLGKLAIASIISSREFSSPLSPKFVKSRDWPSLSKSWIGKLWALANEGGTARQADNPLPNVSFVTFNYDRCIQQFIALAIDRRTVFRIPKLLKSARRYHASMFMAHWGHSNPQKLMLPSVPATIPVRQFPWPVVLRRSQNRSTAKWPPRSAILSIRPIK